MDTLVEFRIEGTLCCVVSEEEIVSTLSYENGSKELGINGLKRVGNCSLLGRRYLILCAAPVAEPRSNGNGSSWELLTPRELQVALLVASGCGNKQVADRLKLSEWTVSSYLRRIFVKLGVRTRAAMVAKMMAEPAASLGP